MESNEDDPGSIWSNPSPIQSRQFDSPSTSSSNADIWASVPSHPSTTTTAHEGYNAAYLTTPPPTAANRIDEFDPYSPTTSSTPPPPSTLLGSGVRKNSKLVLIDTDSEEEEERDNDDDLALRKRLEREALELHERDRVQRRRDKEAASATGGGSFNFVGNMFKSLSSAATSPTNSRPSTPNTAPNPSAQPPLPTSPSKDRNNTSPPPPPPNPNSPLPKPFASIASVFRSSPSSSSQQGQPSASSSLPPSSSSSSLLSVIAGKGKEKQQGGGEITNEKQQSPRQPNSGRKKDKRPVKRPDPTFDFSKFLEQMRSRQADPIAKYLRSFLKEFSRKPPQSTTDQTKVINDFLDFIASKMRQNDPWKSIYQEEVQRTSTSSSRENEIEDEKEGEGEGEEDRELEGVERAEMEFELSLEAMEKLVMNRLWHLTFTPALDPAQFEEGGFMSSSGDLERDQVVRQRIRLFGWIEPRHLDLPISVSNGSSSSSGSSEVDEESGGSGTGTPVVQEKEKDGETGGSEKEQEKGKGKGKKGSERGFIEFAATELRKMNQYKAPRDKLICVLNCCKVIFGLIRHVASSVEDQGADTFIPFLIYVVLQANPDHLVSNLQYIQRFRNPEKLAGEGGYYLSSLNAAISFIETLDASALSNIDQAEFEHNVANAVKLLASEEPPPPPPPRSRSTSTIQQDLEASRPSLSAAPSQQSRRNPSFQQPADEETSSASLILPNDNTDPNSTRNLLLRGSDSVERAMSKPIGALARIFEQLELTANEITGQTPPSTPPVTSSSSHSNARPPPGILSNQHRRSYLSNQPHPTSPLQLHSPPSPDPALYAPETVSDAKISEQIERQERESHEAKMGTLMELFSGGGSSGVAGGGGGGATGGGEEGEEGKGGIEREVVEMVLWAEQGDVGRAVERLLEMV